MAETTALILDFDQAVKPLPNSERQVLDSWQECVRFACSLETLARLDKELDATKRLSANGKYTVFLGSGDYHHLSYLLIARYRTLGEAIQIVVFDNHPDNMRYPWGIHCGSWVWHVSRLPFVSCVHVLGITSTDVEAGHAWENHLQPLRSGKVRYWCVGCKLGWTRLLGITACQSFSTTAAMLGAFAGHIQKTAEPIYFSIDKDVLTPDDVRCNWDQGGMRVAELESMIRLLRPRMLGSDITGDISSYRYGSRFKRFLSGLDKQPEIAAGDLDRWQIQHQSVNLQLLRCLHGGHLEIAASRP